MRCKQCKNKIEKGDEIRINMNTLHQECRESFITHHIKKVQEKKKEQIKKMKERNDKQKAKDTAWRWFSKFIRLRDADRYGMVACIDCGIVHPWDNGTDAGHYIPKGAGEIFYFDENNVHGQSRHCNYYGSQDTGSRYRIALSEKIGKSAVIYLEQLKASHTSLQRTTDDYRTLSKIYREKFNELKKTKDLTSA